MRAVPSTFLVTLQVYPEPDLEVRRMAFARVNIWTASSDIREMDRVRVRPLRDN